MPIIDRKKKTVLILEDREKERQILEEILADRGFAVVSAGSAERAREILARIPDLPDVFLLDMVLEGATLGAEFGLEVRAGSHGNLPEFLIHSAYDEPKYTQLAFRLGARAFLRKPETSSREIVRHIRVLALMKALRPEHPKRLSKIEEIAERSQSKEEALASFCRDVLCPELDATLGAPYILLASQSGSATQRFGSDLGLPEISPAYDLVQDLVHKAPWVVDPERAPKPRQPEDQEAAWELFSRLKGTAFIPLGAVDDRNDLRLALGIVQEDRDKRLVEDALELAKLLGHFVSPAVMGFLLSLTHKFHEIHARQRAVLEATAKICLYVGQEQISLFEKALESEVLSHDDLSSDLGKLLVLGENLRQAGELLAAVVSPARDSTEGGISSLPQVVTRAWRELTDERPHLDGDLLHLQGECTAAGAPGNLQIAVARLLGWMAKRLTEYPGGEAKPAISVRCSEEAEPRIVIEDNSRRLPRGLRDKLFAPFSTSRLEDPENQQGRGEILGPYLAKALVEVGYQGHLEDRTDEIPGDIGHRFVLRLRRPSNDDAVPREARLHG